MEAPVAFGRRVPERQHSLPPIRTHSAPAAGSTRSIPFTTTHAFHPAAPSAAAPRSTIARQMHQRRAQKTEEMMQEQLERERAEAGMMRVLMSTSQERLVALRRHRDALREENSALVARITHLEGSSMKRIAEQLQKHMRFAASAAALEGRGLADRAVAQGQLDMPRDSLTRDVGELRRELGEIQEEIAAVKAHMAALQAHYHEDGDPQMGRSIERLERELVLARASQEGEEQHLVAQRDAARAGYEAAQSQRLQKWAEKISKAVYEAMAPEVKAMAMENVRLRGELDQQTSAREDLALSVAQLEEEQRVLLAAKKERDKEERKHHSIKGVASRREPPAAALKCIEDLAAAIRA